MKQGRQKGKKNLQKWDGYIRNEHGVTFTDEEVKVFKSLVNSANRKRRRMLEEEMQLPQMRNGKETGKTVGETTGRMGAESDFIIKGKSKSLQRFRNHKEFESYVDNLKRVTNRNYVKERVKLYHDNYKKGLISLYGEKDAKDLVELVENINDKEFMRMIQSNEDLDLEYRYGPEAMDRKRRKIRKALEGYRNGKADGGLRNNRRRK